MTKRLKGTSETKRSSELVTGGGVALSPEVAVVVAALAVSEEVAEALDEEEEDEEEEEGAPEVEGEERREEKSRVSTAERVGGLAIRSGLRPLLMLVLL